MKAVEQGPDDPVAHLTLGRPGATIAYRATPGRAPGILFLTGYRSVMTGEKATALAALARRRHHACVRFDYSGHGASSGLFENQVLSDWLDDALAVLDRLTSGPQILVGSSMGGYLALLVALHRPNRVKALIGIATAADFTERLVMGALNESERERFQRDGELRRASPYEAGGYPFTWRLVEDGRRHLVLDRPINILCPVRLLHGARDTDVPPALSHEVAERLTAPDVQVIMVKDGDHRLSRPTDLRLLTRTVEEFL
jgi:pimeloyl-ACP methyl ester carboxylesterase